MDQSTQRRPHACRRSVCCRRHGCGTFTTVVGSFLFLSLTVLAPAFSHAADQTTEIELLKRRIRDLEEQNRAILRTLEAIKKEMAEVDAPRITSHTSKRHRKEQRAELRASGSPANGGSLSGLAKLGSNFQLYGFLRVDTIVDDSLPDNAQKPFFIRSPASRGGGKSNFTLHPRLTRLGLDFDGPRVDRLLGADLTAKFEVDFQNRGSESRQIIRIRHAYVKLEWDDLSLLAGQTWDLVSPLYPTVNNDTLMWNAGNLGDRRPQLRLAFDPDLGGGKISLSAAAGLTGAINARDLDGNGVRDGEASTAPNFQGRIGYGHPLWYDGGKANLGVWGHYALESTETAVAGKTDFDSYSTGLDYDVHLTARVSLRGEAWYGRNLDDFRGGIAQGVNLVTGKEIRSWGTWTELGLRLNNVYSIYSGYTTDDPRYGDLPAGGRTKNRAWYVVNRFRLHRQMLVGVDYLRWRTDFKALRRGTDNRVNMYVQYDF